MSKRLEVYAVGYSNGKSKADTVTVKARDAHHAAEVANKEPDVQMVTWVEGPFKSFADADQYCLDGV